MYLTCDEYNKNFGMGEISFAELSEDAEFYYLVLKGLDIVLFTESIEIHFFDKVIKEDSRVDSKLLLKFPKVIDSTDEGGFIYVGYINDRNSLDEECLYCKGVYIELLEPLSIESISDYCERVVKIAFENAKKRKEIN